jgi:hypothetical protein
MSLAARLTRSYLCAESGPDGCQLGGSSDKSAPDAEDESSSSVQDTESQKRREKGRGRGDRRAKKGEPATAEEVARWAKRFRKKHKGE